MSLLSRLGIGLIGLGLIEQAVGSFHALRVIVEPFEACPTNSAMEFLSCAHNSIGMATLGGILLFGAMLWNNILRLFGFSQVADANPLLAEFPEHPPLRGMDAVPSPGIELQYRRREAALLWQFVELQKKINEMSTATSNQPQAFAAAKEEEEDDPVKAYRRQQHIRLVK